MQLTAINSRIETAVDKVSRLKSDVRLIAVSKVQPLERIEAILSAGHRIYGENRVQDAQAKWPDFKSRYPDVDLHLIGPLQTNKVRAALELFDAIHTVDRPKLARAIARVSAELGLRPAIFVQVNTGREPQKAGVMPEDLDAMIAECRDLDLDLRGLMCIPPADEPAAPHFAQLAEMAARHDLAGLSMGMSGDFEEAIAHGATHVRVGSAIFGARVPG